MAVLHPVHKSIALTPKYVERFRCIGPDCEDNCCTGWRVSIDKKTYNAYRKIEHPEISKRLENNIKRTRANQTQDAYARIELKPESLQCPMMEERLCAIQKHLGEDKLSNTCFSYPRHTVQFKGNYEQSMTLSCPEAARLALLSADAFDFVQSPVYLRPEMDKVISARHGLSNEDVHAVRVFSLQLMRTQGLEIWQKLAVLGIFCEQLDALLQQDPAANVAQLVENVKEMVGRGLVADALRDLSPDYEVQATAFAALWGRKHLEDGQATLQKEVQRAIAAGLGAQSGENTVNRPLLVSQYKKGVQQLPQALSAAPWLLENYLLNEMFREFFPFGSDDTVYAHYIRLVTRFGLVRLMMAAQCTTNDTLPGVETLVRTVQVFSRRYQHDGHFAKDVAGALKNSGWDSLQHIFRFLKT